MYCWSVVALEKWSGIGVRVDLDRKPVLGSPGRWLLSQSFGDENEKAAAAGLGIDIVRWLYGALRAGQTVQEFLTYWNLLTFWAASTAQERAVSQRLCSSNRKKSRNSATDRAKTCQSMVYTDDFGLGSRVKRGLSGEGRKGGQAGGDELGRERTKPEA